MAPTVDHVVSQAAAARSMLHSLFTSKLSTRTKLRVYEAYVRSRLTYAAPAWYALCAEYQKNRLQVQQNRCLRLIVGAQRYVRNDVIHKDTRTPTVEEFVRNLARSMFARAGTSACQHLQARPTLPPNAVISGDEEDDALKMTPQQPDMTPDYRMQHPTTGGTTPVSLTVPRLTPIRHGLSPC